jgi:membrane protease subunit HflK
MARAQAATVLMEAESYKAKVMADAEGEASRFEQIYESYRKTPDITRRRMYLEAITALAGKSDIVVVDESVGDVNLFSGMDLIKSEAVAK